MEDETREYTDEEILAKLEEAKDRNYYVKALFTTPQREKRRDYELKQIELAKVANALAETYQTKANSFVLTHDFITLKLNPARKAQTVEERLAEMKRMVGIDSEEPKKSHKTGVEEQFLRELNRQKRKQHPPKQKTEYEKPKLRTYHPKYPNKWWKAQHKA